MRDAIVIGGGLNGLVAGAALARRGLATTIIDQRRDVGGAAITSEITKVVIGQTTLLEKLLMALLADGHVLLEGPPGLAKTQLVSALGKVTGGSFRRIQLLPDMLPSDITGTLVYHPDERQFRVQKGPILDAHFLLADEINRTPPKVQAAFLQAMQEREVTLGADTYALNDPFIVLATQNPLEEEGTYPLPEAQLDRFLFKLLVEYPDPDDELRMLDLPALDKRHPLQDIATVTSPAQLITLREAIKEQVYVSDRLKQYIVHLVRANRYPAHYPGLQDLALHIRLGASPRRTGLDEPAPLPLLIVERVVGRQAALVRGDLWRPAPPEWQILAVPQTVLTDGRQPMFRSMRQASRTIASSR